MTLIIHSSEVLSRIPVSLNSTWHGTHVAGIIGAKSNNGTGVAGINWETKILPVRVTGKCGTGGIATAKGIVATDLIDGMKWAAGLVVPGTTQRTTTVYPDNYPAKVLNVGVGVPGVACTSHQDERLMVFSPPAL